jgi:uncharacterized Zn finger protein (UPF0148 family)
MRKCINCIWKGEVAVKPLNTCPVCGDNTITLVEEVEKPKQSVKEQGKKTNFDLNNDGVVDEKDISLAGKVLRKAKYIKKKATNRNKKVNR